MANRYRGGSSASQPLLTWHYAAYQPAALMNMDEKQLRKEYTRLRDIAQKRLKNIVKDPDFADSDVAKYNVGRYKPLREIESKSELTKLLSDLVRFTTARRGSLTGLRKARDLSIATLHESGYNFINKSNFNEFGRFMEFARANLTAGAYDSDRVSDLFRNAQKWQIPVDELKKNFDYYNTAINPDAKKPTLKEYRAALTKDMLKDTTPDQVNETLKRAKKYNIPVGVLARNFKAYYKTKGERVYTKQEYLNAMRSTFRVRKKRSEEE